MSVASKGSIECLSLVSLACTQHVDGVVTRVTVTRRV